MFDKSKDISDLKDLFTSENSNNGVWIQVAMLGKKWNIDVKILGRDSDEYQKFNRQKIRELQKHINIAGGKSIDIDDDAMDSMLENKNEEALVLFAGIKKHNDGSALNLEGAFVPIEKTEECEQIYNNILTGMPELKEFILKESAERSNFLSSGKKN